MGLEDIPEVDLGNSNKGAFVIIHEQTTNQFYLRAVDGQGCHLPLYVECFRGEVLAQNLPTAFFCPRGGGFFEINDDKKTITCFGKSGSFGRFDEAILTNLLKKYVFQHKKEYAILIEKEVEERG